MKSEKESVKSEASFDSNVTFDPDEDPKAETEADPEDHKDYVREHVPKKFGIEDIRKYDFRGMTPKQRISAMASIVAERMKGDLFIDIEEFDPRFEPRRLNSNEIVVGATVDTDGNVYARYPLLSQEDFY